MLAQNDSYACVVCQRASGCNKRVRRSERESSQGPCAPPCKSAVVPYQDLEPEAAGGLVNVPLKASQARMERIDRMTSGFDPSSFTLPAVRKETKTIAGYFMPPLILTKTTLKLETCHCKVDRAHKGRGLGGLLLGAAGANVGIDKGITSFTVKFVVSETNAASRNSMKKGWFQEVWPQ